MRANILLAGFWCAGTLVAVGVGLGAIGLIGDGLTSSATPLSSRALDQEADEPAAGSSDPSAPQTRNVRFPGVGSVIARCSAGRVEAVAWSPEQGYWADHVDPGPGRRAVVVFESDRRDVTVTLSCVGGAPRGVARVTDEDRDEDREEPRAPRPDDEDETPTPAATPDDNRDRGGDDDGDDRVDDSGDDGGSSGKGSGG